ncbi:hypothetical protein [Colwellia sp. 12G3]|uniref:hypothetical protein n=1 Tax=Colwellia sp. 12G3 TaxID=2058299 RepID=UPI000C3409B8|nr:hypothetical protein [Colwellia sp. 12G3]PKI16653.1 hypothetical protein CXF71_08630 [Colwellia sp. 12G3]
MKQKIVKLLILLWSGNIALSAQAQVNITVDTSTVVASDVSNKLIMRAALNFANMLPNQSLAQETEQEYNRLMDWEYQ